MNSSKECPVCSAEQSSTNRFCSHCGYQFKRFFPIAFVVLLVVLFGTTVYLTIVPCRLPIKYAIGNIDSGFNLTKDQAKQDAIEAENRWEKATGKNIFQYDDNATLKINFVYTDLQARTNDILAKQVQYNIATSDTKTMAAELDAEKKSYETDLASYNAAVERHNHEVDVLESQPFSQSDADRLNAEKRSQDAMAAKLDSRRDALNKKTEIYNQKVAVQNQDTDQYNQSINAVAGKNFIAGLHIEKLFQPDIKIYDYESNEQLIRLMMHEMGHEFIRGHAQNEDSIMYWKLNDKQTGQPTAEDIGLFCKLCNIKK